MDIAHQLTTIFCEMDDFCKELDSYTMHKLLPSPIQGSRGPECSLSISEVMTILVMFHKIRYRDFKTFYCGHVQQFWQKYFPKLPSYQQFISIMKRAIFPLTLFTQFKSGKRTGMYYIDSSCLPVCNVKRSKRHKTFAEVAKYGKTSIGWFFGLKLHLVINEKGELIAFKITKGNKHDSQEALSLLKTLKGLAFGDKGYIGKKIFDELLNSGLKLITRKKKNMKQNSELSEFEKQLLNQRNLVETVIDNLKYNLQIWHTRHRSILNALTHLVAAITAYAIEPLKLSAVKLLMAM